MPGSSVTRRMAETMVGLRDRHPGCEIPVAQESFVQSVEWRQPIAVPAVRCGREAGARMDNAIFSTHRCGPTTAGHGLWRTRFTRPLGRQPGQRSRRSNPVREAGARTKLTSLRPLVVRGVLGPPRPVRRSRNASEVVVQRRREQAGSSLLPFVI